MLDFLNDVLTSHCLSNGDACNVGEMDLVPSLLLEECELTLCFRQCLVSAAWNDVFHIGNNRINICFGHYLFFCQADNVLLGFALFWSQLA